MSLNLQMRFYLHLKAVFVVRGGRKYPYLCLGELFGIPRAMGVL